MPPRLLTPRTWLPATPIIADSTGTPTIAFGFLDRAANRADREIEIHDLALAPAFDSAAPSAANFTPPSSSISPISAQVFVLPISSATMCRSFFVKPRSST